MHYPQGSSSTIVNFQFVKIPTLDSDEVTKGYGEIYAPYSSTHYTQPQTIRVVSTTDIQTHSSQEWKIRSIKYQ